MVNNRSGGWIAVREVTLCDVIWRYETVSGENYGRAMFHNKAGITKKKNIALTNQIR